MSSFKKLSKSDVTVVPYYANKQWSFTSSSYATSSVIYKGTNLTSSFSSASDPVTAGQYERLIYKSINQLFFQDYTGSLNTSSLANSIYYASASQNRPTQSYFVFNDNSNFVNYFPTGANETIQILAINRGVYGNKILPNTFILTSSAYTIADDGYGNLYDTKTSKTHIGSIFYAFGLSIITRQNYQGAFTSSFTASFKNEHSIHEHEIRCLIKESDFNLSYNPTLVTNYASGSVKDFATGSSFYTYATTVGLYNDNNELLAVAKFGKPMLMSPDTDMTFVVKYDT
jgi:hypothetical protein